MIAPTQSREIRRITTRDRDNGFEKESIFDPIGKIQTPSNVTRMARAIKHVGYDGKVQVVNYQAGVGTGSTLSDIFTGGAFGHGIAEVRTADSHISRSVLEN